MKWNGKVHPAAAVFPMLPEDQLAELAADIVANGLVDPIVLLPDGTLLEGRNRQAACDRTGTWPTYVVYDGDDPAGYVLSRNVHRRHMTTGARAMAAAVVLAAAGKRKGGRWERDAVPNPEAGNTWRNVMTQAGVILDVLPELAPAVIAGAERLNAAHEKALKAREDAEAPVTRLAKLRAEAPDLAEQVDDERLALTEAEAAWRDRDRRRADEQRDARALLARIVDLAVPAIPDPAFVETWADRLGDAAVDLTRLDAAIATLARLRERIRA